ncbi:MAG: sodium:proton antiporter [Halioglobus sp.]|nr:sodium:proton antiporter [Halioglobus sp.]
MHHHVMLALVGIGMLSLASQWLAWRFRIPAILFLLASGLVLGPATGLLNPNELFGDLLFPFISLSVAVILFEGSLTLKFEEIRGHGKVVRNLITVGVVVTWLTIAVFTHYIIGTNWQLAFLFGSIMTVTGPTVIMPMLQAVRPNQNIANILRWEGILIDPVGAILAVLTFTVILASQASTTAGEILGLLLTLVGGGLLVGGGAGYLWGLALRSNWIPRYLQNVATLLIVFAVYALADVIENESGLLAVTVMGVWLANTPRLHTEDILDFKESLSILLVSGLFILLAARVDFEQLRAVGFPALLVMLGIQFIARPLKVFICSIGSKLTWQERLTIAWIGPRGIIAAAISAVFALRLEAQGASDASLLVPLTFVVIVGTVVLQSLTARPLARLLKVALPEPEGVLIVGANPMTAALAETLHEAGFSVVVSHSNWDGLRAARMAGITTFYGNPMSDHADRTMDLAGIGKLFAMSRNTDYNHLACAYFSGEFGRQNVYALPVAIDAAESTGGKHAPTRSFRGRRLFDQDVSLSKMLSLLSQGATIKTTLITDTFSYEDYLARAQGTRIPLTAWNQKGQLTAFRPELDWQPSDGWTVASLALDSVQDSQGRTRNATIDIEKYGI